MEGVVVLAVRPVWGGAGEVAEAVDSVPDYVVRRPPNRAGSFAS